MVVCIRSQVEALICAGERFSSFFKVLNNQFVVKVSGRSGLYKISSERGRGIS